MTHAVRRAAAWLALGLVVAAGCGSDRERFEQHLQRASEFIDAGRPQEGLVELRAALEIEPDSALASHRIAVILEQAGQTQDAVFFYREAYRLDPERDYDALSAAQLTSASDPAGARALVEELIEREPGNAGAHARLASIALLEADTERARRAALEAVRLGPGERDAWLALGQVEQARIRELRLRGEAIPRSVYAASLAAFEQAAVLGEPGGEADLERARVLATWPERADEAPAAYRLALERSLAHGSPQALHRTLNAALAFGRAGDVETLRAALGASVDRWPDRAATWYELATLEEQLAPGSGDAVFARALGRSPTVAVQSANAAFLVDQGRGADAIALLEAALREQPNEPSLLAGLANLQSRIGDQEASRETLRRLSEAHPGVAITEKTIARIAARDGRLDVAAQRLRALAAQIDDVEALLMLARTEYELRDLPAALGAADQAIRIAGNEATSAMYLLRAELRYALHDHRGTLEDLRRAVGLGAALTPHDRLQEAGSRWALGNRTRGLALLWELLQADHTPLRAELMYIRRLPPDAETEARVRALRLHRERPRNSAVIEWLAEHEPGGTEAALARLDTAIADGLESPRLLLQRAELRLEAGDLASALGDAELAFERGSPGAGPLLARIHERAGRLAGLATTLEQSAEAGTLDGPGKILLAHLQIARGESERAEALLVEAIQRGAARPSAKSHLALLLAERDVERARELALDAVGRMPGDPTAVYALGAVSLHEGLPEQALAQFDTALALQPRSAALAGAIHMQRGLALEAMGLPEEAQRAFDLARTLQAEAIRPSATADAEAERS